jgi:hypothetical protein
MGSIAILNAINLLQLCSLPQPLEFKVEWDIHKKSIPRFGSSFSDKSLRNAKPFVFQRHLQRGRNS